ncbi:hypothetical protein NIIDNTM18_39020 [Mycolicibacterium litorale]|uniref:PE-PGRS family protein n=1 Tax=Mycolicibacterium litorale TaxID=758802 RepID=A0A6S6P7N4_9MYCO|nr:hypothetical protein [Mycolicibacterium litorale]BCI54624.1 hypothetical protein NIIDNTM18_39020 [Mycolicibacterium litorale]
MQLAARPYLATGVALVGASAIALSPVAPPMPDVSEVVSRAVAPAALANPFGPVFDNTVTNIEKLVAAVVANPAPILTQVIENQIASAAVLGGIGRDYVENFVGFLTGTGEGVTFPGQLRDAFEALEDGDYGLGFGYLAALPFLFLTAGNVFGTLGDVIPQIGAVLAQPFTNLGAAITAATNPQNLLPALLGVTQLTTGTAQAFGEGLEGVASAVRTGDLVAVVNAVLETVADTVDTFVNDGLLASSSVDPFANGVIGGLLWLRNAVAQAIAPQPTATLATEQARIGAVDELPSPEPTVITVSTASDDDETEGSEKSADRVTAAEEPSDDESADVADELTDDELTEEEAVTEDELTEEEAVAEDQEAAEETSADQEEEAAADEAGEPEQSEGDADSTEGSEGGDSENSDA